MVAAGACCNQPYDSSDGTAVVVVNGSATLLTCSLGNGLSCSDLVHSVSVNRGDLVEVQLTVQTYSCGGNCTAGGYNAVRVTLAKR
jgi:hypothetical protein